MLKRSTTPKGGAVSVAGKAYHIGFFWFDMLLHFGLGLRWFTLLRIARCVKLRTSNKYPSCLLAISLEVQPS